MSEINEYSQAILYGKGVFTTISIRGKQPFLWDKHWRRISDNAAKLGIDLSGYTESGVRQRLDEALAAMTANGRARISFLDISPGKIWPSENMPGTSMHILTGDYRTVPDSFRLTVSPHLINSASPLTGIKSCNYLEHLMAWNEAKGREFDEAIRLNERGEIASACMANVFWLKGGELYTTSMKTGCLPGTTREFVLENLECKEIETGIEALREADAMFLTSAGLGVVRVAEFDGRELKVGKDHTILKIAGLANTK